MDDNLLAPLYFDDYNEANKFTLRHLCMCGAHLLVQTHIADGSRNYIVCPRCGDVYQHTVITSQQAERIEQNQLQGKRELRPDKPPRPAADILKELGLD